MLQNFWSVTDWCDTMNYYYSILLSRKRRRQRIIYFMMCLTQTLIRPTMWWWRDRQLSSNYSHPAEHMGDTSKEEKTITLSSCPLVVCICTSANNMLHCRVIKQHESRRDDFSHERENEPVVCGGWRGERKRKTMIIFFFCKCITSRSSRHDTLSDGRCRIQPSLFFCCCRVSSWCSRYAKFNCVRIKLDGVEWSEVERENLLKFKIFSSL